MTREQQVEAAVAVARRLFEFGAEQLYVAINDSSVYVTDDPLDRNVVLAVRTMSEVERAGGELAQRLAPS